MKLYHAHHTSAFRCRWMLEEAGLPYELINISLGKGEHKRPEYLQIHPLGSVPALVDGEHNYIESAGIVMHVADMDPEQRFAPAIGDPRRGHYYQWILFAMTNLYQVVHPAYLRYFFKRETASSEDRDALSKQLGPIDDILNKSPFLLGEQFTGADVIVGGTLLWAESCGLLLGREPQASYLERLKARPAFQRAAAE